MDITFVLILLVMGAGAGFAAGLLGIGGGMVLGPLLTMVLHSYGVPLDLVVHAAIATAMASILFTSISSAWAHHKRGAVIWHIVALMVPGLIIGGALAGGAAFSLIPTSWLSLFFGLFVSYSAFNMLRAKAVVVGRTMPGPVGTTAAATGIGFISGLVGAGGGFLSVPFLARGNVPLPKAIATSAALGFPIALANTIGYIYSGWSETASNPQFLGYVYWPALLILAITSILAAPRGAAMAHRLPVATLKRIFAFLLFALAGYMLWTSYVAFTH